MGLLSVGHPRGGTLIVSLCRLGPFLGVQNFDFNIFQGFQRNEYVLGYEEIVDIFGVITKLDYFGGHYFKFWGFFLRWEYCFGVLKFQIMFWVCLNS